MEPPGRGNFCGDDNRTLHVGHEFWNKHPILKIHWEDDPDFQQADMKYERWIETAPVAIGIIPEVVVNRTGSKRIL